MGNTLQTPPQPHEQEEVAATGEEFYDVDQEINGEEEESFTCEICIEPTTKKSTHAITSCAHQYCIDCMIKYIKVKIEDDNEAHIKCPAPNCTRALDPVACAPLVGPAVFVRWCDVLCRSALSGADSCYCPYADCSELLVSDCARIHQRGSKKKKVNHTKKKKSQCPMCKRWFCSECQKAWHAGFGCDDVPTDGADVAFGALAERMTWKRCPNCGQFVERRDGCRLVRCRCGICFCYKCGEKVNGWSDCVCNKSCQRCCSWCIRFFIILAISMVIYCLILHYHKHATHKQLSNFPADVALGRLAERMTWKRCPNCRHFVELREGCLLVKCRCGIYFCYKCGKKAVNGWCNCAGESFGRWCSCCVRSFIYFAIVMLPTLLLLFLPSS